MSSNRKMFWWLSSFKSLISRRAVMGNWMVVSIDAQQVHIPSSDTDPILLIVHDDLLESDQFTRLLLARAMDLAGNSVSTVSEPGH